MVFDHEGFNCQKASSDFHCVETGQYSCPELTQSLCLSPECCIQHPFYGTGSGAYPNDIATLRWNSLFGNLGVAAVSMAGDNDFGTNCHITGWGYTGGH